jgi:hypothetical protein
MERIQPFRDKMATIPEDLTEYARVHTGPGSWSAENFEASPKAPELGTPRAPYVSLRLDEGS